MNYILKLLFKVFKPSPFNENEVICHTSEATLKALNNLLETGDISEDTKVAIALVIDFVKESLQSKANVRY